MNTRYIFRFTLFSLLLITVPPAQAQAQWFGKNDNADELYEQAVKETDRKNYKQAITLSRQALEQRPDFIDIELLLGRIYMQTKDWANARKHVNNVLKKDPRYLDAYYYKINIEVSTKQYGAALAAVDAGLKEFPNRKDFLLRKLGILDASGQIIEGNLLADELMRRSPRDREVRAAYIGHYIESARRYKTQDLSSAAVASLQKALEADPSNAEAREMLDAVDVSARTRTAMIDRLTAELESNPTSYALLMQKLNILREDLRYAEALTVLQTIFRYHPQNTEARALETELRKEAAAFYSQTDPYMLYQSILERNPGDREALLKVIGLAKSRGAYREAMTWVNAGLRREPQATDLLLLKLDLLEYDRAFTEAAQIAGQLLVRSSGNNELQRRYIELKTASARYFVSQQQYLQAQQELNDARRIMPRDTSVLDVLATVYTLQRRYDEALAVIDELKAVSNNEEHIVRQVGLLSEAGRYDEAADLLQNLIRQHPGEQRYIAMYTESRLLAGSRLLQQDEFRLAAQQLNAVLEQNPTNREALHYLINLYSATNALDSALLLSDQALTAYPDDREFLLKKSSVLNDMKRYTEANSLVKSLMERYPYTLRYRDAYVENLSRTASKYQGEGRTEMALDVYKEILTFDTKDSTAYLHIINTYLEKQQYDTAHVYINQALQTHPNWTAIYLRRAQAYEGQKEYLAAAAAADTVQQQHPSSKNQDYADYLRSRTLKNQFGLHFLRSSYDYSEDRYDIATVEYMRLFKKGSIGGRLNYAGRQSGTGLQGEAELYYTHHPKWYSHAYVAFANKIVFPQWRLGYTAYRTFQNDGEIGLGARYLQRDTLQSISGMLALTQVFGDFWFNARAYAIWESEDINSSFALTGRYYMNKRQDFLSMVVGLGTSPDDRSRLIQFSQLSGLLTRSVGAGYQRTFHYRTSLGLHASWITQKVRDEQFQNQYDLYISVIRRF